MLNKLLPFKSNFKHPSIDRSGYRALIITTSQATLDTFDKKTQQLIKSKKKTGVYASEMTEPYYTFLDAEMEVEIASIQGGKIPIDPLSMIYPSRTREDWRFSKDKVLQQKVNNSININDAEINEYDIIFISGGWGAAYDLMQSEILADKITQAYAAKKVLAAVCHGALGLVSAKKPNGQSLVMDVKITGVTNAQLKHLMISRTPKHPEVELRKVGANYYCKKGIISDLFANCVVVDEQHRIVSGQNQRGGVEVAYKAMMMLENREQGTGNRELGIKN